MTSIRFGGHLVPMDQVPTLELTQWLARARLDLEEAFDLDEVKQVEKEILAAELILEHRNETGEAPPNEADHAALAAAVEETCSGLISSPSEISDRIRKLSVTHHVVAPSSSVEFVADGFAAEFSFIRLSLDEAFIADDSTDICPRSSALKRIAVAANVCWDSDRSGRRDAGTDPHVVSYQATGSVTQFDGTSRTITGSVSIDLREGSKAFEALRCRYPEDDVFRSELRKARANLHEKAETSAKTRAICELGVKRRYSQAEFARPFAVVKLVFTGQSVDPELQREFALMRARARFGASVLLYGNERATA